MCGIAGFYTNYNYLNSPKDILINMTQELSHRGPDSEGYWQDQERGIALGHKRLAIQDLSKKGSQPMISNSGRYILSYNGEIYNHLEIREEINQSLSNSCEWKGTSDTETILSAFELWGIRGSLEKFIGQFAISVWDSKENKLFLTRDRFGEKPLYFGWTNKSFVFASELKAIKRFEGFNNKIDKRALNLYVRHSYVPTPFSIFENIYKLQPGTLLEINSYLFNRSMIKDYSSPLNTDNFKLNTWWSIENIYEDSNKFTEEENVEELVEKELRESIRLQLISDVPIGCFLSGGIDSSLIAILMQKESEKPINTFTVGFKEGQYNESTYAREIANHIGSNHKELFVTADDALKVIPKLCKIYDEPFSDVSQIPTYLISKLAKDHVTVILSGDAGDELFGGYNRYRFAPILWNFVRFIPHFLRKFLFKVVLLIPKDFLNNIGSILPKRISIHLLGDKLHKLLIKLIKVTNQTDLYNQIITEWHEDDAIVKEVKKMDYFTLTNPQLFKSMTFEEKMMFLDAKTYLTDDILTKVDRASMSVSLETRVPFLDHRLFKTSTKLRIQDKVYKNTGKVVLRNILKSHMPKINLKRPKQGFSVPIGDWLKGPLKEWAEDLLNQDRIEKEGFFDSKKVNKYWKEHLSGQGNWEHKLWNILMFQSWLEEQHYEEY